MSGHGEKRTRKESAFMLALLSSGTIENAARIAGISTATAHRWYGREEFQIEFKRMQGEIVESGLCTLRGSMTEAVDVLRDVMNNENNPAAARVAAARYIIDRIDGTPKAATEIKVDVGLTPASILAEVKRRMALHSEPRE
ncbi:hypothetical protein FACS1894216_18670 [Synergistales bacterium]|nr:hypothetical protein FACS1894216_18670 [Synergistales bacterium]